jgi:hypothetical protein
MMIIPIDGPLISQTLSSTDEHLSSHIDLLTQKSFTHKVLTYLHVTLDFFPSKDKYILIFHIFLSCNENVFF